MSRALAIVVAVAGASCASCASSWQERAAASWRGAQDGVPVGQAARPAAEPRPAPHAAAAPVRSVEGDSLRARLQVTRVGGVAFEDEESLRAVVGALAAASGLPLIVHPLAQEAALDAGALFRLELQHPIPVADALAIVCEQAGADVTWTVRHDVVLVTTAAQARGSLVVRTHDVRALAFGLPSFTAPRIDRLRLLEELEDEDGVGPFGGVDERATTFDEDEVVALVQEHVVPGTWDDEGVSIAAENGVLIVVHTREAQAQVALFLARLGW